MKTKLRLICLCGAVMLGSSWFMIGDGPMQPAPFILLVSVVLALVLAYSVISEMAERIEKLEKKDKD